MHVSYLERRSFDEQEVVLDISYAGTQFGWKPKISLADGIQEQLQWLRSL